jgi:[acyl-carrier-protein] S-malonyltransferase
MTIAFVFPGQGSQTVGMLGSIAEENPGYGEIVKSTFYQASEVLGFDLWDITQNGPESELNNTCNTQPAMLAAGYAMWQLWLTKNGLLKNGLTRSGLVKAELETGGRIPVMMAGHSLGEYTALVCAQSLDFKDAIELVSLRGQYMQSAVAKGEGAMAAVLGLDDEQVIKVCAEIAELMPGRVVSAVNFNSPGQVVIAGNSDAVDKAIECATHSGAKKVIKLPVSVPSHCALMESAAEKLETKLASTKITAPIIPVINNVHAMIENDADSIRRALVKQLSQPVRWVEIINKMMADGIEQIVECGPGKVLAGLNKHINRRMPAYSMYDVATIDKTFEELL